MGKNVLVVGGGFGGINAVTVLAKETRIKVLLIDKRNHHLFQPLLYQVATAGLAPSDIATPIRGLFSHDENVEVLLGEVTAIDRRGKTVTVRNDGSQAEGSDLSFDYLILACGAEKNYFGHNEWENAAPSLKGLEDAIEIRKRILLSYERAEASTSETERKAFLTYVIVGGGPTGVELAGAISEIAHTTLKSDFRKIDPQSTEVYLVEAGPRILASFAPELSERARRDLEKMNVKVLLNCRVQSIAGDRVTTSGPEFVTRNVIWTAGVRGPRLNNKLGLPLDDQNRAMVRADLSVADSPDVFIIGDMAHVEDPKHGVLPGLAAVAMQQGRHAARQIIADLDGRPRTDFDYRDRGIMATIGRKKAVVQIGSRLRFSGFTAWLLWLVVHIVYLIGFRNKAMVLFQWAWSYLTFNKGSRLIIDQETGQDPGSRK